MLAVAPDPDVRAALDLLDKKNVLFAVHGPSCPWSSGEDLGVGTPHSSAAQSLFRDLRRAGYTGLLFGPEGQTTPVNPSPYDATWFSRSELLVAAGALFEQGWITDAELRLATTRDPTSGRAEFEPARRRVHALVDRAYARISDRPSERARFEAFRRDAAWWLDADALYDALSAIHGRVHHDAWPPTDRELLSSPTTPDARASRARVLADRVELYAFTQWLVHQQRETFRHHLGELGLELWGDLQVGPSMVDAWRFRDLFSRRYLLGAPPSRTNPEGQPWGYPVPDPTQPERVRSELVALRRRRFAEDYDGLRIDHPHGWVCPWVYRAGAPGDPGYDALRAVQSGARLFESIDLPDHPELSGFARIRRDQLNPDPNVPRYDDGWVVELEPAQVEAYAALTRALIEPFPRAADGRVRVASEVLSTQPHPLARVTEALGLGRFRVTQKADPDDPRDVYRSERARPDDWVMVGTHDTRSIWSLADEWAGGDRGAREARDLGARSNAASELVARIARDPDALVHAKVADVFASPAQNVIVFFADQFGCRERYNAPGTVGPENWTLRVPYDPDAPWPRRLGPLNVRRVLAWALQIRFRGEDARATALQRRLHSDLVVAA